jgi:4-alpha-glucanotransferase
LIQTETAIMPQPGIGICPKRYRGYDDEKRTKLGTQIETYWTWTGNSMAGQWAKKVLNVLRIATDMLLCAEDLGVIRECVPDRVGGMNILGLRVERWASRDGRCE